MEVFRALHGATSALNRAAVVGGCASELLQMAEFSNVGIAFLLSLGS